MALDEAGNGELAVQVDHARRRSDVRLDGIRAADRLDAASLDRNRLGLGRGVFHGDDAAVREHEIRRRGRLRHTRLCRDDADDDGESDKVQAEAEWSCHGCHHHIVGRKRRSKLAPKICSRAAASAPTASSARRCASAIAACHPRGKNDESVPNSNRLAPTTASDWRNTASSVRPGTYLIQLFELEVSRWIVGHWSAAIRASRKNPAPKCGMITGTDGYSSATRAT